MNIEKVFNAVSEDEMNSPLPAIVFELEKQGYVVKLEGLEVKANDLEDNLFVDLERAASEFEIELVRNSKSEQKFKLVFSDYHQFNFQNW